MENKQDRQTKKFLTSIRISLHAKELIAIIAAKLGISQAAVIEIAVRVLAEREKVE